MILVKIIGIAFVTVFLVLTVRPYRPEFAFAISVAAAAICFFTAVSYFGQYTSSLYGFFADMGVSSQYFGVALKALGLGYVTEFAADTARDAGQSAMASKIVFGGRVCIFILAFPLIKNLLEMATELVGM
ncbi:MAG: stage III sporulation AC/AD family protein [Acutalibacteraceae bacterium]|nr:stage III sporulation AC/AD family protein [Acutalibacteraceae bacterium]